MFRSSQCMQRSCYLPAGSKRVVPQRDELKSTWEHRFITAGTIGLLALLFGEGVAELRSFTDVCCAFGSMAFAYYLSGVTPLQSMEICYVVWNFSGRLLRAFAKKAPRIPCSQMLWSKQSYSQTINCTPHSSFKGCCADFLTGMYHWGVDNYGDGSTPIVGSQIEAFQGHHQKPWTITEREFCNNIHKVGVPRPQLMLRWHLTTKH